MRKRSVNPRYTEASIPTAVIAGLVTLAQARGLPAAPWFAGTGLDLAHCDDGRTHISFRQAARIIGRALRALPGEAIGLRVGARDPLLNFGVLGFAMMSCRNFGEALEVGIRDHQASGSLMDVALEHAPGTVALRLHERFPHPELLPFLCEEACASSLLIARAMLGAGLRPLRLELSYAAPPYAAAYRRLFGCPVQFGAQTNRMSFDAALLDRALPAYNPANLAMALSLCRQQIDAPGPRRDVVVAVERLLERQHGRRATMVEIAQALLLSERSLRRQLQAAGESFNRIRDRVLERRARQLLREARLPVGAIADELGFSDGREFRRAFRRWTGVAPRALRG